MRRVPVVTPHGSGYISLVQVQLDGNWSSIFTMPALAPGRAVVRVFQEPATDQGRPHLDRAQVLSTVRAALDDATVQGEHPSPEDYSRIFRVAYGVGKDGVVALVASPKLPQKLRAHEMERKPWSHPNPEHVHTFRCAEVRSGHVKCVMHLQRRVHMPPPALPCMLQALATTVADLDATLDLDRQGTLAVCITIWFNDYDNFVDREGVRTCLFGAWCFDYDYFWEPGQRFQEQQPQLSQHHRLEIHRSVVHWYSCDARSWLINRATGAERVPSGMYV